MKYQWVSLKMVIFQKNSPFTILCFNFSKKFILQTDWSLLCHTTFAILILIHFFTTSSRRLSNRTLQRQELCQQRRHLHRPETGGQIQQTRQPGQIVWRQRQCDTVLHQAHQANWHGQTQPCHVFYRTRSEIRDQRWQEGYLRLKVPRK